MPPVVPRALNFSAGPATLPLPALERAREELLDFAGTGASVMEQSHRGKEYDAVHNEALSLVRELMGLPADWEVLLLQGGASMQFPLIPLNFLHPGQSADYIVTGAWGEKALAEAEATAALCGTRVRLAASSGEGADAGKPRSYTRVTTQSELAPDASAAYLHFTSNETIHGVQFAASGAPFPDPHRVPVVVDMSSDFLWRPIDLPPTGLFYAGAQKNLGPSGIVAVVVHKAFLASARTDLPKIFQYRVHAESNSLYNTPPTFSVYLVRNVLAWLKEQGGLAEAERRNRAKAALVYAAIDAHPDFYRCPVDRTSRSVMNVVFRLPSEALEARFIAEAKEQRMIGLKGHRSVGGIRVSLYNAVELEWVRTLTEWMAEFVRTAG